MSPAPPPPEATPQAGKTERMLDLAARVVKRKEREEAFVATLTESQREAYIGLWAERLAEDSVAMGEAPPPATSSAGEVMTRLRGYNPPDRVQDDQRQIAQDIHDAAEEIAALRAALREIAESMDPFNATPESIIAAAHFRKIALRALEEPR